MPYAPGLELFLRVPAAARRRLLRTRAHGVPPGPVFVALARFTYAPGAFFLPAAGAGPVSVYVEAGSLTFNAHGHVGVARHDGAAEAVPPATDFTLLPGDRLLMPGNVVHTARSDGPEAAATLGVAIFAGTPAQEFPPGIAFIPLAIGQTGSLTSEAALVTLERLELEPGAHEGGDDPVDGVQLLHVLTGPLQLRVRAGQAFVSRGAAGPFAPPEVAAAPAEVTLGAGDAVALDNGVEAALYAAQTAAVLLRASLQPAPGVAFTTAQASGSAGSTGQTGSGGASGPAGPGGSTGSAGSTAPVGSSGSGAGPTGQAGSSAAGQGGASAVGSGSPAPASGASSGGSAASSSGSADEKGEGGKGKGEGGSAGKAGPKNRAR